MTRAVIAVVILAACSSRAPEAKHFGERFYSGGADHRHVLCSKGVDRTHEWPHAELAASLEHARIHGVVLQTYGHAPTLDLGEYLADFDWAAAHGVKLVTYRELAGGYEGAGWAFTVDDDEVDAWFAWRDTLRAHHAHVTFFVTNFAKLLPAQVRELAQLEADGHDVEAHSATHQNAVDYAAAHGVAAYVTDEVLPSQAAIAAAGLAPAVAFSYPYGAHTHALDAAILPHFAFLRTTGAEMCLKDDDGAGSAAPR